MEKILFLAVLEPCPLAQIPNMSFASQTFEEKILFEAQ